MLTTLNPILKKALRGNYAVGAFNINDLEILQAVMHGVVAERSPVILQTSEGAIEYAGMEELAALAHIAAKRHKIPTVFHLDHGKNRKLVKQAIKSGLYTSVMYDGSSLPFKDNLKTTKEIVRLAHAKNMSVEAELGAIAGIEDFVSVSEKDAHLTNPEQATQFVKETKCDALAVAIGTSHGAHKYKGLAQLDFDRLKMIREVVRIPIVLHGASAVTPTWQKRCTKLGCELGDARGVDDKLIKRAVKLGVNKVNIDTDLRLAFTVGIRSALEKHPEQIDPRKILAPAKDFMEQVVRHKVRLLGCAGKAR